MTTQESIITNILVELDHFKVSEREVSNKGAQDSKVSRPKMLSPLPTTKFPPILDTYFFFCLLF